MEIINEGNYGEKLYKIGLWTGTAWVAEYGVYAYNEQEACDLLADYVEENERNDGRDGRYYAEYAYLFEHSDYGSVDEYAEAHNLTCCGNHGIYLEIESIKEITQNESK